MSSKMVTLLAIAGISVLCMGMMKSRNKSKPLLYYSEINRNIVIPKDFPAVRNMKLNIKDSVEIQIYSLKGKSYLTLFSTDGVKKYEGGYVESFGLLRRYIVYMDPNSLEKSIRIQEYYQPIKEGIWIYYNELGEKIKEVTYSQGIAKDSI